MNKSKISISLLLILTLAIFQFQAVSAGPAQVISDLKYLSVLRVETNFADWDQLSWEQAAPIKETETFQWFEATIYEASQGENVPNAIHLYKFDDEFDPMLWFTLTSEEWINYRESYVIARVNIPEGLDTEAKSRVLSEAFIQLFSIMVADTPSLHYGLRYAAHGSGTGSLFGGAINPADAQWLLENMNSIIGRRLDFLDMSHNCLESTTPMHGNFYMYFDYIVASDWLMGGYAPNMDHFFDTDPDYMFPLIMTPDKSIRDGLEDIIDIVRLRWEYSMETMIENKVMQALYLFDAHEYETLVSMVYQEMSTNPVEMNLYYDDLYTYVFSLGNNDIENQFEALRIYYKDNKDFFTWEYVFNGIHHELIEWVAPDFRIFSPYTPPIVKAGASIDLDLIIRQKNGLTSPITLDYTNSDPWLTAGLSDVYGEDPMHASLSITTMEDTPLGVHTIQVTASSGVIAHTVDAQIMVVESSIYLPLIER